MKATMTWPMARGEGAVRAIELLAEELNAGADEET
jgi:hypothetical protein